MAIRARACHIAADVSSIIRIYPYLAELNQTGSQLAR
jgi:hypothetical protein